MIFPGSRNPQQKGLSWGKLDFFLLILLLGFILSFFWGLKTNAQPREWSVLGQYLWRHDGRPGLLLQGLMTTIRLTLWAGPVALVLGVSAGLARTSRNLYLRLMGGTYVQLCRNLPPLVLIFLCYYFLADQITASLGLQDTIRTAPPLMHSILKFFLGPVEQIDVFITAAITLGLYEGAYVAEIVRGAIQAVDYGQWEAGRALGFARMSQLRFIILPQATRNMIPALAGQGISTIKDSAIVSVISIQELTFQGMQLMATTYLPLEVWTCVAVLYFMLTFSCSLAATQLENKLRRQYST